MLNRRLFRLSLGIVITMAVFSLIALVLLPAEARLPIHWSSSFRPDMFLSRDAGLVLFPLTGCAGLGLLLALPKRRFDDPYRLSLAMPFAVLAAVVSLAAVHVFSMIIALT